MEENNAETGSLTSLSSGTERHTMAKSSTVLRGLKSGMVNPIQPLAYASTTQLGRTGSGPVNRISTGNFVISVDRARQDISPQVTVSTLAGLTVANFPVSSEFLDKVDLMNICMGMITSLLTYVGYILDIYNIAKAAWEDYEDEAGYDNTACVVTQILGGHIGGFLGAMIGSLVGSFVGGYVGSMFGFTGELVGLLIGSFIGSIVGGVLGARYIGEIVQQKLYMYYESHIRHRIRR